MFVTLKLSPKIRTYARCSPELTVSLDNRKSKSDFNGTTLSNAEFLNLNVNKRGNAYTKLH
jgi:hypothetical protein